MSTVSPDAVREIKKYVAMEKQIRAELLKIIEKGEKSGDQQWDMACLKIHRQLEQISLESNDSGNRKWLDNEIKNWERISTIGGQIAYSNSFLETELGELKRDYLQSQRDAKEVPETIKQMYERTGDSLVQHMRKLNDLEKEANKWSKALDKDSDSKIELPGELDDQFGAMDKWVKDLDKYQQKYRSLRKFSDGLYRYFYENKTELREQCLQQISELRRNVKRLVSKDLTTDPASEYRNFEKDVEKIVLERLDKYADLFEDWDKVNQPLRQTLREFNEEYVGPAVAEAFKAFPDALLGARFKFIYNPDGTVDAALDKAAGAYKRAMIVWRNAQYELLELKITDLDDQMANLKTEYDQKKEAVTQKYELLIGRANSESESFLKKGQRELADLQRELQRISDNDLRREDLESQVVDWNERMEAEKKALATRVSRYATEREKIQQVLLDDYRDQLRWLKEQLDRVGR